MNRQDKTEQMLGQKIASVRDAQAQYRLEALLGQRPGRRTFLATEVATQSQVVVKLLLFGPDFTWEELKLFEREAETLKSLSHPKIPRYLDSFEANTLLGDGFVLVQSYISARDLQRWVDSGRRFDEAELRAIARSVLNILEYLHSLSPAVIHRDIKPSNILLDPNFSHERDMLYLVDFGSVQATSHGGTMTVVGTYGYMPPEQFGGRSLPASDLYSLGMTLIYLITGQHPADLLQASGQLDFEQIAANAQGRISPAFISWLRKLTQTEPSKRLASAAKAKQRLSEQSDDSATDIVASSAAIAPTYSDFKIRSTPRELELQCLPSRLAETSGADRTGLVLLFTATCAIALFASLIYGSSGLFLIVLIMFPVVSVGLVSKDVSPREKAFRRALAISIGLRSTPQGMTYLSLDTLLAAGSDSTVLQKALTLFPQRGLTLTQQAGDQKRIAQLAGLRLKTITMDVIAHSRYQVVFHFDRKDDRGSGQLSLDCQQREAEWLYSKLTHWNGMPKP